MRYATRRADPMAEIAGEGSKTMTQTSATAIAVLTIRSHSSHPAGGALRRVPDRGGRKGIGCQAYIGMQGGHINISSLENMPRMVDAAHLRPQEQWWLGLRLIARLLSQPGGAEN
jgi:hypothetical protein